jgi:osmotically-inducible protein OsmY
MTTSGVTDGDVREAVIDELRSTPGIQSSLITVSVHRGAVTLDGEVSTFPEKRHAEQAALRVHGVNAVAEQISVRSLWSSGTDALIAEHVNKALAQAVDVPAGCVTAAVHHRQVTLSGSTPWQFQRAACLRAVGSLHGVVGVINEIEVRPAFTAADVHEAITAALLRSAELQANEVVVTAADGDITLTGRLHTWAERHEAELTAWAATGVTNVNNHLLIDDPPGQHLTHTVDLS